MDTLCISITFLDPYFHGRGDYNSEWPPSPWRLFQAILSTAAGNGEIKDDAFYWFESLKAPEILAPEIDVGMERKTYVPDNASDVELNRQKRLSEKLVRSVIIKGTNTTLHYLWIINKEDHEFAGQIAKYAKQLTSLGWGIDLVAGNGQIITDNEVMKLINAYVGKQYLPKDNIGASLRYAVKGSYDNLKMVHKTKQNRFDGTVYSPPKKPTVFEEVGYIEKEMPFRYISAFRLLLPLSDIERWASFDPRYTVRISSWVRGFLCDSAKESWTFNEDREVYVAGHHKPNQKKTPPRFSYLPLPTIGHPKADGLIRRVMVVEPYGDDGTKAEWAGRFLHSAVLRNEAKQEVARVEYVQNDSVIEKYCTSSKSFQSVTPVILPGHDSRRYPKAEKLFLKAVDQAGFDVDDIDYFILQKAPFFNGGYHPNDYQRVSHLARFTAMHVFIRWKSKLRGPLVIGAGRHRGLGLFMGVDDEK